jgi:hypothetical protein
MLICRVIQVLCIQGFLTCRKHAERIILLVEMLQVIWMLVPYVLWSSNMQSACVFLYCHELYLQILRTVWCCRYYTSFRQPCKLSTDWKYSIIFTLIMLSFMHCACAVWYFSAYWMLTSLCRELLANIIFIENSAKEESIYMSESMS